MARSPLAHFTASQLWDLAFLIRFARQEQSAGESRFLLPELTETNCALTTNIGKHIAVLRRQKQANDCAAGNP